MYSNVFGPQNQPVRWSTINGGLLALISLLWATSKTHKLNENCRIQRTNTFGVTSFYSWALLHTHTAKNVDRTRRNQCAYAVFISFAALRLGFVERFQTQCISTIRLNFLIFHWDFGGCVHSHTQTRALTHTHARSYLIYGLVLRKMQTAQCRW